MFASSIQLSVNVDVLVFKLGFIDSFLFINRSEREFLYEILGEVIKAGATTLNIPDTVGYNWPREFGQLIVDIKANTPGIENVIISTHCQNDLGLSTANTLEDFSKISFPLTRLTNQFAAFSWGVVQQTAFEDN
ncbi:hypothetical protein LXL04_029106 [Taraxacum kok-saghyz]